MTIKAISDKYNVDTATMDFWVKAGYVTCERNEENGYRIFNEESEEGVKRVLIIKAMGITCDSSEHIEMLKILPKEYWNDFVISKIEREIEKKNEVLRWAKEMASRH